MRFWLVKVVAIDWGQMVDCEPIHLNKCKGEMR